MKIVVFGHSYLEPENQKTIIELSTFCDVNCILPANGGVNIWSTISFSTHPNFERLFSTYNPFYVTNSQYFLWTLTMGFHKFQPDIIVIEYNPWSIMFVQAWLCRSLFCRKALIVCYMKKNTYQIKPGFLGYVKKLFTQHSQKLVDYFIAESKMVLELLTNRLEIPKRNIIIMKQLGVDLALFKPIVRPEENKDFR